MKHKNLLETYSYARLNKRWRHWRLKNTFLLLCGLGLFFYLSHNHFLDGPIHGLGALGYGGAVIAGIFFVSTYTVIPAGYVLFALAQHYNPLGIAVFAGIGSMLGDYLIFRFIKDHVLHELKPYIGRLSHPKLRKIFRTPYFAWMLPLSGAIIIASPLPDELGISMLGLSKIKNMHFLLVTYLLNAAGIFFVVLLGKSLQAT